ncbi:MULTISPECIES: hypothetical protein [unclassified Pseudonocardia]|jgi:hypothetical protein|uniref:hypothetical protein n=1 Tax=unclassified Pseudonocardia TaxID=2619320 RepID=UPI000962E0FA|nr:MULTISPECIES: hypothetical protein [unclassified Pseudonocardia]MBN9101483.1 hypothetical protein [Pseudonocardia sp.]OJY47361.1 MAG: hypothetical protein BGP03_30070 [Pseudonocardia sp. 73-21]
MLDLLPPRLRDVATVVALAALTTDAARELEARLPPTDGLWRAAARHGLAHPELAAAARVLFDDADLHAPHAPTLLSRPGRAVSRLSRSLRRS